MFFIFLENIGRMVEILIGFARVSKFELLFLVRSLRNQIFTDLLNVNDDLSARPPVCIN